MDPITVRLEEEMIEALDAEYEERGFRNRTLYIRQILEERNALFGPEGARIDVGERVTDHEERLASVEERLDALEEQAGRFSWMPSGT